MPTTGLSSNDVTALSVRVREMMVKTLNEISVPVPESSIPSSAGGSEKPGSLPAVQTKVLEPAPLAAIPTVSEPGPDIAPLSISTEPRSDSRASTNQSDDFSSPPSSTSHSKEEGSEAGMETEEDEGMVLVGRPNKP